MRHFYALLLLCLSLSSFAQNPFIVKTITGTQLEPTSDAQITRHVKPWNGKVFYQGKGTSTQCILVVTDGTTAGTVVVSDLGNAGDVTGVYPAKDFVFVATLKAEVISFSPFVINYTRNLWRSDGTGAGTLLLKAFEATTSTSNTGIFYSDALSAFNYSIEENTLYFGGYESAAGTELWKSDGTVAGTFRVKDIYAGTGGSGPFGFCKAGNTVCFFARDPVNSYQLWKTDGTDAGTQIVKMINPAAQSIAEFYSGYYRGKMYFWANDGTTGAEVWYTDGTAAGTQLLKDIVAGNNATTGSGGMRTDLMFIQDDNYLYFPLERSKYVWRTDGTADGTIQLNTTPLTSAIIAGASAKGKSIYWQDNVTTLYKSNGTPAGTTLVKNNLLQATQLFTYKGAAWLNCRGYANNSDAEPWRSDGTAANTARAFDLYPGSASGIYYSSDPYGYFELNGYLYFFASNAAGRHLFRYLGDMTFNNSIAGGRWRDSANWNSMMPPGITDTVYINAGFIANVDGAKAYSGTLIMQSGSFVNLPASTDSLFINAELKGTVSTGSGAVVLSNTTGDTVKINSTFTGTNVVVNGVASLNANLFVSSSLNVMSSSRLLANNSDVELTGVSSVINASASGYIVTNGTGGLRVQSIGNGARSGTFTFPIGTVNYYNPVYFSNNGTADVFKARVQPGLRNSYSGETPTGSAYNTGAVNATWFITEGTAGGSDATIGLQWNAAQELTAFDRSQSRLGHYTGGSWQLGAPGAASGANPYTWSGSGYSSFSPFGIFNSNATLPLYAVRLSGFRLGNANQCNWTISGTDINKVELETSADGRLFRTLFNAGILLSSGYKDFAGNGGKTFYRLKVTDVQGAVRYSNVIWIDGNKQDGYNIYPALMRASLFVQTNEDGEILQLFAADGRMVLQQRLVRGTNQLLVGNLQGGSYFYKLMKNGVITASGQVVKE